MKIRLPDKAAYEKLQGLLAAGHEVTHAQENYFFDGDKGQLGEQRVVLRVRLYDNSKKATVTLKGKQILVDGIGRASELEESADPADARRWLTEPNLMLEAVPLVQQLKEPYKISSLSGMGGFKNLRGVYKWEGETLELDETSFAHGILYEIECETSEPEQMRNKLEAFLTSNGITYSYSKTSKFANFKNKSLL